MHDNCTLLLYFIFIVVLLCCIGTGYCAECGSKYCDSWTAFIFDTNDCRSKGRVYWVYTQLWSLVPLTGLSNFHIGKRLDGAVKLFHGFATFILGAAMGDILNSKHVKDDGLSVCMASTVLIVDMVKVVWDYFTEKEALSELIIVVIALLISGCILAIIPEDRVRFICSAFALTASLGVLEWLKHIVMIYFNIELDINGCALL